MQSIESDGRTLRRARRQLTWRGELLLAVLPTTVVLLVLAFVEALASQRVLFASLAGSAFLIYLDPNHGTNRVVTIAGSQLLAAVLGFATYQLLPHPYFAAASAMVLVIVVMIVLDVVHPPAISTALAFAFRTPEASSLSIFAMAAAMTAVLVLLQRAAAWTLLRAFRRRRRSRSLTAPE